MKKISQIIFIFLLFILSFSQSFGEEYWQCEKIDGRGFLFFNEKSSCDISSHPPCQQCKTDTCKKINPEGLWICKNPLSNEVHFIGDVDGCKNFQEANPLKCNCAKEGAGVNIVPVDLLSNSTQEDRPIVHVDLLSNSTQEDRPNGYKLLARIGSLDFVSYDPGKDNFVGNYLPIIFELAIGIISALAVIMLIVAGIQYMGEDSIFGKTKAKNQMTNALLGLLIALGSFAILNTISPNLIGTELKIRKLSVGLDESVHGDAPHSAMMDKETGELYFCNDKNYTKGKDWGKDSRYESAAITRAKLKENDIQVNKTECEKIGDENCTSVYGLKIDGVLNLKEKCPSCNVIITGGTECWLHSVNTNHRPGNKIVDLNINDGVKGYIEDARWSVREKIGEWGGETNVSVFSIDGVGRFVKELVRAHYHVVNWDGK